MNSLILNALFSKNETYTALFMDYYTLASVLPRGEAFLKDQIYEASLS